MSDEELEGDDRQTRKLVVKVEKDDEIERLTRALEERDELLQELAQEEFQKQIDELAEKYPQHRNVIENITRPSELEFAQAFLSGEPRKSVSKGVVSLRSGRQDETDLMRKAFESPLDMIKTVYQHSEDPTSPYFQQMKEAKDELWKKALDSGLPREIELPSGLGDEASQVLGTNYSHEAYTNWLRRREAKRLRGQK